VKERGRTEEIRIVIEGIKTNKGKRDVGKKNRERK